MREFFLSNERLFSSLNLQMHARTSKGQIISGNSLPRKGTALYNQIS